MFSKTAQLFMYKTSGLSQDSARAGLRGNKREKLKIETLVKNWSWKQPVYPEYGLPKISTVRLGQEAARESYVIRGMQVPRE